MKRYFLIITLLFTLSLHAQSQSISGIVSNSTERCGGAVIRNLGSSNQTTSNDLGMFTIRVKKGDTLLTSKLLCKTDTLVYEDQAYLSIELHSQKQILHEVTIRSTTLSPKDVYEQNKKEYKDIYWKGDYSQMFGVSVGMMPGVALNIDKLYSLLSKQGKDARKMQHTLTRDYHDDLVDRHFTKTLVSNITGYDGPRLDTFMMKYRPTYEFITKATDFDVINYVKEKFTLDAKAVTESVK
jgi:hypothetical protein